MTRAIGSPVRGGEVLYLTRSASVQFSRPITVRVIRPLPERHTYDGWLWIEAYELSGGGDAFARRELYVRVDGLIRTRRGVPAAARLYRPAARS